MPIVKRFPAKHPPVKKGNIVRRNFSDAKKSFADNVEEYVFGLPSTPMRYPEMIRDWVVPYKEGHFIMFGQRLKLFPQHVSEMDGRVKIVGILVEIVGGNKPKKQIINGPRGVWHGKIKYFVKTCMGN